jgi:hypothetical protein
MADKAIFTGAVIQKVIRTPKEGTAEMTCSLTQSLCETMNWPEMPDRWTDGSPEGVLAATTATLRPNDDKFSKHAFDLDISKVSEFVAVRIEPKGKNAKAKAKLLRLKFKIHFAARDGAKKLVDYMLTIGDAPSKLSVSYTKQEVLPMEPAAEDGKQGKLEDQVADIAKSKRVQ